MRVYSSFGRSKSLSALKADSIFHHDAKMSLSIENLLPTSENDAYSLDPALDPDLEPNQNETLDYDLGLDESLFEHKKGTKSEGQLSNPPVPIQNQIRPLPIDDLSKKHRKHSDPYITYDQQTGTSLRPEHETLSLPRDLRSYPDFQVNDCCVYDSIRNTFMGELDNLMGGVLKSLVHSII